MKASHFRSLYPVLVSPMDEWSKKYRRGVLISRRYQINVDHKLIRTYCHLYHIFDGKMKKDDHGNSNRHRHKPVNSLKIFSTAGSILGKKYYVFECINTATCVKTAARVPHHFLIGSRGCWLPIT
jgi:hypothetical protein